MTEHADRSPAHLSGGQRRRAALATVLACEPEILVLDEPSANLDPVARRELAETLATLPATMIIVTHDLPYAAQLCDRAVVMDDGVVVADDTVTAVLSDSELLAAHRLELPWGFVVPRADPRELAQNRTNYAFACDFDCSRETLVPLGGRPGRLAAQRQ